MSNSVCVTAPPLKNKTPKGHRCRTNQNSTQKDDWHSLFFRVSEGNQSRHIQARDRQCERNGDAKDWKDRSCSADDQAENLAEEESSNQQGAEPKANAAQSTDETASAGLDILDLLTRTVYDTPRSSTNRAFGTTSSLSI